MEELKEKMRKAMWVKCSEASLEESGIRLPPWENAPASARGEIVVLVDAALRAIEEAGYCLMKKGVPPSAAAAPVINSYSLNLEEPRG